MHMIERQGLTLVGVAVANLDEARPRRSAVGRVAFPPKRDGPALRHEQAELGFLAALRVLRYDLLRWRNKATRS
jgi:hypothetical protein